VDLPRFVDAKADEKVDKGSLYCGTQSFAANIVGMT